MGVSPAPAATNTGSIEGPALPAETLSKGDVKATPGMNTTPADVATAKAAGWTPAANNTTSPTVLSDANIRENVIPSLTTKASGLTPTPTTTGNQSTSDSSGTSTNTTNTDPGSSQTPSGNDYGVDSGDTDYGDIYAKVFGKLQTQAPDPASQQNLDTLKALSQSQDTSFATQIRSITDQYTTLMNTELQNNVASNSSTNNFLLRQGLSSTSIGNSLKTAQHNAQIADLSKLQTQENNAIAKIQDAQKTSDYKAMSDQQAALDKITTAKKALADKISTSLLAANTKAAVAKTQNTIDNAVANIFTSGTTDPNDILTAISGEGLNVTLADINKSLGTLSKSYNGDLTGLTGNVKNFYSLKDSGSLPASISALPADQQLEAFLNLDKKSTGAANSTKPLYTASDGTTITKSDIEGGVQALDKSKGSDGYVDPNLYLAMYQKWEDAGLSPADFIKQYPPKYYVNPANTNLPPYLRPTVSKTSAVTPNPFAATPVQ